MESQLTRDQYFKKFTRYINENGYITDLSAHLSQSGEEVLPELSNISLSNMNEDMEDLAEEHNEELHMDTNTPIKNRQEAQECNTSSQVSTNTVLPATNNQFRGFAMGNYF